MKKFITATFLIAACLIFAPAREAKAAYNVLEAGAQAQLLRSMYNVPAAEADFNSKYNVTYVMCNYNAVISDLKDATKAKKTMQAFIDAAKAGKASYFHCRIGSDRTGYWGLLVEGLLGISVKDSSIDYELTSFARNVTSGDRPRNSGLYQDGLNFFKNYDGNTLQEKINNYLVNDAGITQADIDTFKSIILEDVD